MSTFLSAVKRFFILDAPTGVTHESCPDVRNFVRGVLVATVLSVGIWWLIYRLIRGLL